MKPVCFSPSHLHVRQIPKKGWGVVTTVPIKKGAIVEVCPVLVVSDREIHDEGILGEYTFDWAKDKSALPLGYAMLYNHADKPNLAWYERKKDRTISFYALRNIEAGEELTHSYYYSKDEWAGVDWR
jgi:SET domain-containing protein